MSLRRTVNLEWWKHEPGVLGIGRQGINADGTITLGMRDPLTPRTYGLATYLRDQTMKPVLSISNQFTMETIHRLEALPGAPFVLARTDQDLYFVRFSGGRVERTTFQPGRGMHFHDVAVAGNDTRRTVAILTQDRTGLSHTLCAAEARETLMPLWTRTWTRPLTSVAVSPSGNWFAVGFEDGGVILLDRRRKSFWDHAGLSSAQIVALVVDDSGSVTVVDAFANVKRLDASDGSIRWRVLLSADDASQLSPDPAVQYYIATDAASQIIAVAVAGSNTSESGEQSLVSRYVLLDGETGGSFWEDTLPSLATGLAVSHTGDFTAVTTRNGDIMVLSTSASAPAMGNRRPCSQKADILLTEAIKLVKAGQLFSALPIAEQALKADPTHVDAASAYEEIKWQLRDFVLGCTTKVSADSLNIVDKALMVIPHDEKLTVRRNALNRLLTEQWTGEGQIALDDERFLEAISCFLKALDLDQANVDARSGLKRAHVRQSEQLRLEAAQALSEKNYVKAASFLERVAELAPNDKSVAEELQLIRAQEAFEHGMECYLSKRYPESAFQFKKTLTLDPNHKEAARHLRFAEAFARRALDSVPTAQEPVGAIASRFEALE